MKLSLRGEYALRALLVLSLNPSDQVVRIQHVSEQQNIPRRFLEQILNDLKGHGFVESRRGLTGGYRLRLPPHQITLAAVVRAMEGPLAPINCVSERFYEPCTCPNESTCAIRSVMAEVRDAIVQILERVTLADLRDRARKLQTPDLSPVDFII